MDTNLRDMFQPLISNLSLKSGWNNISANAFVDSFINTYIIDPGTLTIRSQLLYDQLFDLADNGWTIDIPTGAMPEGTTQADPSNTKITIPVHQPGYVITANNISYGNGTLPALNDFTDNLAIFVGSLAHELGHAEDYNVNHLSYVGNPDVENSLSVGAQTARNFISEGKAMLNNIKIAQQLRDGPAHIDIPVSGDTEGVRNEILNDLIGNTTRGILDGAISYYDELGSGDRVKYLQNYWEAPLAAFRKNPPALANQNVLYGLIKLNPVYVAASNGLELTENANANTDLSTITMKINFDGASIYSSYINTFGGYGAITPSGGTNSGEVLQQAKSPSPDGVVTGQIFNFTAGGSLVDQYNWNGYSEAIIKYSQGYANLSDVPSNLNDSHIVFSQLNQEDEQGQVTSSLIGGDGVVATLSNVANVVLNEDAKATIFGTNNTITLNGSNTLRMGVDPAHPYGPTNNIIKNFGIGDTIEFLGAVGFHSPGIDANGVLNLTHNDGRHVSVQLEMKPYLKVLDFSFVNDASGVDVTATVKAGYEIVGAEAGHTLADIAARYNISVNTLQKINSVFTDASFDVGGLVHVPLSAMAVPTSTSFNENLPALPAGLTYVYNPASGMVFTVAPSLDGHDSGALIIDPEASQNAYTTFDRGRYDGIVANDNINSNNRKIAA